MSRWTLLLLEYDLAFMAQKSIKGREVSEFLGEHPTQGQQEEDYGFPDEHIMKIEEEAWDMYFGGVSNQKGCGVGVLLVSLEGAHTPLSVKLDFEVTNNGAEYEACTIWLRVAI